MTNFNQGDIYWIDLEDPIGSAPGFKHPHVIVQNNVFNKSKISTVVVCVLTSNVKRATIPGNVLLTKTGLPRDSVAVVTQIVTVDKSQLVEYAGHVSEHQLSQILEGIILVLQPE